MAHTGLLNHHHGRYQTWEDSMQMQMFSRPGMHWYSLPRKEQSNCFCQTTRDIVEEVYMKYVNGIVPLSMEWDIRIEVHPYFHD
jgi:hypothetical protein